VSLLDRLGIEHPIMLGPLGGGPATPELVAAVSAAGGLGFLGAAYQTPDQIRDSVARIRALTDRPFGINLFAGAWDRAASGDSGPALEILAPIHARLGIDPPFLPRLPPDPYPAQLEVVLDLRPAIFSFTFGPPSPQDMARLKAAGILVFGKATTLAEARMIEALGADAVVAQGAEAGAHRGTFFGPFEAAMVPVLDLVAAIGAAVSIPVLASGGLMDGADIAAALRAGAIAAKLGTAFLATPESGAAPAYKAALLAAGDAPTVLTTAFSGRPARGLPNAFVEAFTGREESILPYPLQNALTRPMRAAAAAQGRHEYLSLWAGTGIGRIRALPAGDLVRVLAAELRVALA
jgi:nitronate monooxygenase